MKISSLMVNGSEYEIQDLELTGRVDELESKQPAIWEEGQTYTKGQLVSHNGILYKVCADSTVNNPSDIEFYADYEKLTNTKKFLDYCSIGNKAKYEQYKYAIEECFIDKEVDEDIEFYNIWYNTAVIAPYYIIALRKGHTGIYTQSLNYTSIEQFPNIFIFRIDDCTIYIKTDHSICDNSMVTGILNLDMCYDITNSPSIKSYLDNFKRNENLLGYFKKKNYLKITDNVIVTDNINDSFYKLNSCINYIKCNNKTDSQIGLNYFGFDVSNNRYVCSLIEMNDYSHYVIYKYINIDDVEDDVWKITESNSYTDLDMEIVLSKMPEYSSYVQFIFGDNAYIIPDVAYDKITDELTVIKNRIHDIIDETGEFVKTDEMIPEKLSVLSYIRNDDKLEIRNDLPENDRYYLKYIHYQAGQHIICEFENFALLADYPILAFFEGETDINTNKKGTRLLYYNSDGGSITASYHFDFDNDGLFVMACAKGVTKMFNSYYKSCLSMVKELSLENNNDQSKLYPTIKNIVCSGSSITFGRGRVDDAMVGGLIKLINAHKTYFVDHTQTTYTNGQVINNDLLYNKTGVMLSGIGSKIEFTVTGDELSICQAKLRSDVKYGIMQIRADGQIIGTFDNKNRITHHTETFSGTGIKKIQLTHSCTFNHVITINNSIVLNNVSINTTYYGGTMPANADAFVYRTLDSTGTPVHGIEFSKTLPTITSVTVEYDCGRMVAYERSTRGQNSDGSLNESVFGDGKVAYDPAQPMGNLESGMEFRSVDKNAFVIYKFLNWAKRKIEIEIIDGNEPYFIFNFASNRYYNIMNAGIGGWSVGALINNDKVNDYQQFYKWFLPDIIFQESATNDDWRYPNRKINHYVGKLTHSEVRKLPYLELKEIAYDSSSDKYDVWSACGIIDSITPYSLTSSDIIESCNIVAGDIVRIGNYHGDNKDVACRKITNVDYNNHTINWKLPINADIFNNVDSLDDLVGAKFNIRNLDVYKTSYQTLIDKVREINPHTKIVIVNPGLSKYGIRQLWGYNIVHEDLCNENHNVEYCDITEHLHNFVSNHISGNRYKTIISTGASEYELDWTENNKSWQGYKVLVNGVDVYGKDCYVEDYLMYTLNEDVTGTNANTSNTYSTRGKSNYTQYLRNMKLVFYRNVPNVGDEIKVLFADITWSSDYCHINDSNGYGGYLYAQEYYKFID